MPPCLRGAVRDTSFLLLAVVTQLIAVMSVVMFGGFESLGSISARTPQRLLMQFVVALALLLAVSPRARLEARAAHALADRIRVGRDDSRDVAVARPAARTPATARVSGFGLYGLLYEYVPGFNGVRVPARYAMIAGLFLAILAGYGAQRVHRCSP